MNILFMGTPDFAAVALDKLIASRHSVIGVVTQPDKPQGRGHKMTPPAVKVLAEQHDLPVYQPERLKGGELREVLNQLMPDIIVVAAYGRILPQYILDFPKYGCINIHASLLPKYRGAAPIQRAVVNGETETGITIMNMNEGMDTGDIIAMRKTLIGEYETAAELFDRLAPMGGELLIETLEAIENGTAAAAAQNEEEATYAPMITKADGEIDWAKPARQISKLICGMNSWPMAYTWYQGQVVKIIGAAVTDINLQGVPGELTHYDKKQGLLVQCGSGAIWLEQVQFAGTKRMSVHDYIRGHEVKIGEILGKKGE